MTRCFTSRIFSNAFTIANVYTPVLVIYPRQLTRLLPTTTLWRFGLEFSKAYEDLSVRWTQEGAELFVQLPTDHRSDESSTGYSFMGCSPAEPTSASPVLHSFSL